MDDFRVRFDGAGSGPDGRKPTTMITKLGLSRRPLLTRLQRVQDIITAMTGNANFTTPNPPLATVQLQLTATETAFTAYDNAKSDCRVKLDERTAELENLMGLLTQLATYVDHQANGDPAIINSSGMEVRASNQPVGELPPPAALSAESTDLEGAVRLSWPSVPDAKNYTLQRHADPLPAPGAGSNGWVWVANPSKLAFTVTGLESGKRHWFRVAANGGVTGQSAWSNPTGRIPQ